MNSLVNTQFNILIGVLLLVASFISVPAAGLELTQEEQLWIEEHPVIRIHNETSWAPFNFVEDDQPTGFSVEYMNLVAKSAGLKPEYVSGPSWNQFLDLMRSGDLDVMLNIVKTQDRDKYLLFTDPYVITSPVLALQEKTPDIPALTDLYGRTLCLPGGSSMQEYIERVHGQINLLLLDESLSCLHAVADGRADASLEGYSVLIRLLEDNFIPGVRASNIAVDPEMASVMRIATNIDQPILRNILQKAMDATDDDEVARLRANWLGAGIATSNQEQQLNLTDEQSKWISEHPVIRVHNEMDWPPFNFNENGRPQGLSIDYMNLVASTAGLQVEYISGPTWQQFLDMTRSDELDVMLNINQTSEREAYLNFTRPYLRSPAAVVTSDQSLKVESLQDLYGKRLASPEGFSTSDYLAQAHPEIELVLESSTLESLYAVLEGRADAMLDNLPVVEYLINKHTLSSLRVIFVTREAGLESVNALGVRKDWPILRDILQEAIDSLDPQEVTVLRQKWLEIAQEQEAQDDVSTTILWLVGITLGIFILLISLNRLSSYVLKDKDVVLQTGTMRSRILVLGTLSVFIALISALGWIALEQIRERILRDVGNNLEGVLTTTTQRLNLWVEQETNALNQIVKNPEVIQKTEDLLNVVPDHKSLADSTELSAIRTTLGQYQDSLGLGFFVINGDGKSIGSARDSNLGTKNLIAVQKPELFDRVMQGESVFIPPIHSDVIIGKETSPASSTSLFIAVPIRNGQGKVIAAMTTRLDPKEGFSRVLQFSRVGESGESYAFDPSGTLLSASRFEDDLREIGLLAADQSSVINIQIRDPGGNMTKGFSSKVPRAEQPFTHMFRSAIANSTRRDKSPGVSQPAVEKGMDGYRDYRGVPVLGAWTWDAKLGLGLTSEIDVSEALATFAIIRTLSLVVLGVTLTLSLGGTLFILTTSERTNRQLRKARDELEDRVAERTEDLRKSTEQANMILENATDGILTIDDNQVVTGFNPAAEKIWGYPAADVLGNEITMLLPEYVRKDHLKYVHSFRDADEQGRHMESRGLHLFGLNKNGDIFPTEVGISKNEVDGEIYYSAFIQDITERRKAENSIKLAQLVDRSSADAADSDSFTDSLRSILINTATVLDWPVAHVYLANDSLDRMLPSEIWHLSEPAQHEAFVNLTSVTEFALGEGLPGRVAESGKPIWIEDLRADKNFPRNKLANELGLVSGFGFPVTVDGDTLAVLEFYSVLPRVEDPEVITMAVNLGKQLSGVLTRNKFQKYIEERNKELENVSSVIVRWLPDMTISSINDYGLELLGFAGQNIVGHSIFDTFIPDSIAGRQGIADLLENIVSSPEGFLNVEVQTQTANGKELWISWSNNPSIDQDGSLKEILAIGLDLTESKKLEAELEAAMNTANDATKTKSDFLANMSHEIRTPMNAVIGLSDLCLRTDLSGKQRDYLSKIHRSAEALLGIINDILDFSKIEAGHLDMEEIEFEIDEVLHNLATVANIKTQEKGLELLFRRDLEVPKVLIGDPLRLGQVLINLTNNAVKFTEKGEIIIDIKFCETIDERATIQFSVQDTGIGMTKAQQDKLFQAFSQADASTTRKYGGTGLGLSISKQLVELMGGEISVESEADVGSQFIFTVSLGIGKDVSTKTFEQVPDFKDKSALVVDDNVTAREIMSTYLTAFSFNVDEAANSDEAIKLIEKGQQQYDLMILDWLMPGMSGLELAQKIKTEIKPEVDPHIIMVSAFSSDDIKGKPGGEHISKMLSKPVSPSDLFDSILAAYGHESTTQQRYSGSKFDMGILRPVQGAEILLVEDNEINQQVASEILEQAGFFVDIANHGQEALDMLANKEYDCVLMDVQMPVMDGFTATGIIRENPRYVDLPVLAMTANATHEDRERSLDAGMNEHIAKPIRPQILFEALLEWIPHGERILPEMADPDISDQAGSSLSAGDSDGAMPIPQIEGIDTHSSIERLGGSVESYIRLIEKFLDNQVDAIENFSQQIQNNDFETAERTAHTLKGVSALIGAVSLRTISESLEASVRSENVPDLGKEIEEARAELMVVFERFREYLHQQDDDIEESDNDEISLPELKNKLVQLQEKLEAYDAEADDDLREIIKLAGSSSTAPQLKKLAKSLDQYDFEGGLVIIGEILENLPTQGD